MDVHSDSLILWEAHRGGGGFELPESTPVGFEYAWLLGGIPEADVSVTADGRLMSLHDGTLARTARDAPPEVANRPISELTFEEVRRYDIGNDEYPGQVVPSLDELLARLVGDARKEIIIDYKNAPLDRLAALIADHGVARQVTLATTDEAVADAFRALAPEVRIKLWLGGGPDAIAARFRQLAARRFGGYEQIQLHLNDLPQPDHGWRYALPAAFLREALAITRSAGVLLQALPWRFEEADLFAVLDTGVRSFAVDYPGRFVRLTARYFARRWLRPGEKSAP